MENQKQFYFPVISDYGSHMLWNRTMVEGEKMDVEIALNNSIEKLKDKPDMLVPESGHFFAGKALQEDLIHSHFSPVGGVQGTQDMQ